MKQPEELDPITAERIKKRRQQNRESQQRFRDKKKRKNEEAARAMQESVQSKRPHSEGSKGTSSSSSSSSQQASAGYVDALINGPATHGRAENSPGTPTGSEPGSNSRGEESPQGDKKVAKSRDVKHGDVTSHPQRAKGTHKDAREETPETETDSEPGSEQSVSPSPRERAAEVKTESA
jgi:hypothetical protein